MKPNNRTKYLIPLLFAGGTFLLTTGVVAAVQSPPAEKKTEVQAAKEIQPADFARTWLEQINAGQYEKSYNQFDESGKANRSLADWTATWNTLRKQFGAINNRQHQKTESCRTLKGLPDGDYTLVTFKASPFSMPLLTLFERIALAKQPDTGAWTVAKSELLYSISKRDAPFIRPGMEKMDTGNTLDSLLQADEADMAQCIVIAQAWLSLLDQGKRTESYVQLDSSTKDLCDYADWDTWIHNARDEHEKVIKRQRIIDPERMYGIRRLKETWKEFFRHQIPEQNTRIIQFETLLSDNDDISIETVIVYSRPDGSRKVVAYLEEKVRANQKPDETSPNISNRDQPDATFIRPETEKADTGTASEDFPKADAEDMAQFTATALAWLALIDQGKYNESYAQLPFRLKESCSPAQWKSWIERNRPGIDPVFEKDPIIKREQITDPDKRYSIGRLEAEWANTHNGHNAVEPFVPEEDQEGAARTIQFSTLSSRYDGIIIETVIVYRRTNGVCKVAAYYAEQLPSDEPLP